MVIHLVWLEYMGEEKVQQGKQKRKDSENRYGPFQFIFYMLGNH